MVGKYAFIAFTFQGEGRGFIFSNEQQLWKLLLYLSSGSDKTIFKILTLYRLMKNTFLL
jgi:hypothetical protein